MSEYHHIFCFKSFASNGTINSVKSSELGEKIVGGVLPTLQDADFVIKDTDGSKLYVKHYKNTENEYIYNVTVVNKSDEVEVYISSVHINSNNNLLNKIEKDAELLIPSKRTRYGEQAPSNSTSAAKVAETSEHASIAEEEYREGDGAYTDDELSYANGPVVNVTEKQRETTQSMAQTGKEVAEKLSAAEQSKKIMKLN